MRIRFTLFLLSILLILFLAVSCGSDPETRAIPGAISGTMDLSGWNPDKNGFVRLNGEWEFYRNRLLEPADFLTEQVNNSGQKTYLDTPGNWGSYTDPETKKEAAVSGFATFRLLVTGLPRGKDLSLYLSRAGTSYKLYLVPFELSENSKKNVDIHKTSRLLQKIKPFMANGLVGTSEKDSVPQYNPQLKVFHNKFDAVYIIIQAADFSHGSPGGLWEPLILGSEEELREWVSGNQSLSYFVLGILFISVFHYMIFFINRRNEKSSLYFALFCLFMAVRFISTERFLVTWYFPDPDAFIFELLNKIEYSTVYILPALFYSFIYNIYPKLFKEFVQKIIWGVAALFLAVTGIFSLNIYGIIVLGFHAILVALCFYITTILIIALFRKNRSEKKGAWYILGGSFVFFAAIVNDILTSNEIIDTPFMVTYGCLLFILSQSLLLSLKFNWVFRYVEKLNISLARFVPTEFIHFLGKDSILDVNLGDSIEKEMAVLFSDIRSFTSLSESMSPDENFRFLNSYLNRVSPVIRSNNGFIDKYLGDGIMALFPHSTEDAVSCAIEMLETVSEYNVARKKSGYQPIEIGFGIHRGDLMLGTIGEEERIDGTVIADAVNISSRLENLSKRFKATIVVSEDIINKLTDPSLFDFRMLGKVRVRGKQKATSIFEVIGNQGSSISDLKIKTIPQFEEAIRLFNRGKYSEAENNFNKILAMNPKDGGVLYYLAKCREMGV
ncbi:MAG: adenylate/guanylate cyclase domain-containing protein [bacterium]|nr:adenylate/guanylate cyclase domain-containing protein [bacterium]